MRVEGKIGAYSDSDAKGTIWGFAKHGHMYKTHTLANGDHLLITSPRESIELLNVKLKFIDLPQAAKNKYFKQYIQRHASGLPQLQFSKMWVHSLPTNVDLGFWYHLFFDTDAEEYKAFLTIKNQQSVI